LPQGERQITISPASIPAGYKLASFTYGTADLLKNPVHIAAADKTELRVTFDATAITSVKVSGQVANLLTTQGVRVVLMNPVSGSFETSVNPDGSFVFPRVIPGNYVARLSLSGLTASKQVSVADRDVTDVLITYPRQFVVGGHVIVEGAGANADVPEVTLEARQLNGSDVARSPSLVTGTILLTVRDGEYNVSARSIPAGYQLKSITYGTTDLQKAPLKIDGPVTWEIIVRLTKV
jgi:hypothetical protein